MLLSLLLLGTTGCATTANRPAAERRFVMEEDSFAYANELLWDYRVDPGTGRVVTESREPKPEFHHQCFVMARAARQFFDFAEFAPGAPRPDEAVLRDQIEKVLERDPRSDPARRGRVVIPGYASLRELSREQEALLKDACGGSWQSFVQRGHWRIVLPFSGRHQARMATRLRAELDRGIVPAIHLVRFPQLTINHAMLVIDVEEGPEEIRFICYDPNDPAAPRVVSYRKEDRRFHLPMTNYFPGGRVNVFEVYRNWLY
ncbi:MAG TPA: hypothetical protein DCY13_11245 [Verrucomicrobiales bacterium]|nr:hypothetical protein [Verrucomicrobiales bacterium]